MNQLIEATRNRDGDFTLESNMMLQMQDREINQQIATAKKYPRIIGRVVSEILEYATESEDTAQECVYAIPRDGKKVIGPTARFAEIVATSWGNARYAARIIDENATFVVAQAVFHDLEKNTFISVEVPRRIVKANGDRFGPDMIQVTSSAAMSIAMRNAILKGVPKSAWGSAYSKCLALIAGTFETIEARRTTALKHFAKLGVDQTLVLQLLGKESLRDIEPEDIVVLRGTLQAIKDGDTTVRAVFDGMKIPETAKKKADIGGHLERGKEAANGAAKKAGKSKGSAPADEAPTSGGGADGDDGGAGPGTETESDRVDNSGEADGASAGGIRDGDAAGDGGDDGTGDGSAQSAGGENGGSDPDDDIPPGFVPPPSPEEVWNDAELKKLNNAARELLKAKSSEEVTRVSGEFMPIFEASGGALEEAFTTMVSTRRRELRGRARDKL